jgi:hypothetical protein
MKRSKRIELTENTIKVLAKRAIDNGTVFKIYVENILENLAGAYPFSEIEIYIIGKYSISDTFTFTIYSDKAPSISDKIQIADKIYEVNSVVDDTDDDEHEKGLSYSKVCLSLFI